MIHREIHKILIPVDDSRMSTHAFEKGLQIAALFDAEIHVIYVADAESMSSPDFTIHMKEANDDTSPLKEKGAAVLARLMEERRDFYQQTAHLTIDTANLHIHEIAFGILESARVFRSRQR